VLTAVVSVIILLLCGAVVVTIAMDRGPGPDDVAVSYEHAWDRLDFASLFSLSAAELRDGMDRKRFIAAKRAAYADRGELRGLAANVVAEDVAVRGAHAIVTTLVELHDGAVVHNRVDLIRRTARWQVYGYSVAPATPSVTPGADTE